MEHFIKIFFTNFTILDQVCFLIIFLKKTHDKNIIEKNILKISRKKNLKKMSFKNSSVMRQKVPERRTLNSR